MREKLLFSWNYIFSSNPFFYFGGGQSADWLNSVFVSPAKPAENRFRLIFLGPNSPENPAGQWTAPRRTSKKFPFSDCKFFSLNIVLLPLVVVALASVLVSHCHLWTDKAGGLFHNSYLLSFLSYPILILYLFYPKSFPIPIINIQKILTSRIL